MWAEKNRSRDCIQSEHINQSTNISHDDNTLPNSVKNFEVAPESTIDFATTQANFNSF